MKKQLEQKRLQRFVSVALACAGAISLLGATPAAAAVHGNDQVGQTIAQDKAGKELAQAQEKVQQDTKQAVRADKIIVPATSVTIESSTSLSVAAVRALVPELKREQINIHELSKQIQMVNDTGAVKLGATFTSNQDGTFAVNVTNLAKDNDKFGVSISNTGNEYSGDWRTTLSYVNKNFSGYADTLGAAFITSPDNHLSDVKMGAVSYRRLLPQSSSALIASASMYDINQDETSILSTGGLLGNQSSGRGLNLGIHYQKYLSYTAREKNAWDFGIDYRTVNTSGAWSFSSVPTGVSTEEDYKVIIGSIGFQHNNRDTHHSFSYNVGISFNLDGDESAYNRNWAGAGYGRYDENFMIYHAGASYQVRSNSDWMLSTHLHGQYTKENLVGLAQLGAGGMNTVRGFENSISADTGVVGKIEIYTPEVAPHSRLVAFTDYGQLTNNRERAAFGNASIASIGLGYRYMDKESGISLSIDYAKVIDDINREISNTDNHRRWNVMFNMNF